MNKPAIIPRFKAAILLCVFAFSITPKQWLHDFLANHKDRYVVCADSNPGTHFHSAGYHCDYDNLVVESPYIDGISPLSQFLTGHISIQPQRVFETYYSSHLFFFKLRGPPLFV